MTTVAEPITGTWTLVGAVQQRAQAARAEVRSTR